MHHSYNCLNESNIMIRGGAVYIMTNQWNTTLYTGVTSDLRKRNFQHKNKIFKGNFSSKYNLSKLVYFESFHNIEDAIVREKQIKSGSRAKKIALVEKLNPQWIDLGEEVDSW
jgi:putative endonuclease